ncbi:MAG: hypothetical protein K0Q49_1614 [Haloplasmataceae bacterium]|jgi:uncharacterized membrane protein YkvA (DUF1232 family)|nr:hypothetical protein [Haloplasmataceae bacterium]
MIEKIKVKARQVKKQIIVVYLAYMHKDVKWYKKAFLLLILIYAMSPIDLIPDFIPLLGMLDDLILIPLGIVIAMKMIPQYVWDECKESAEKGAKIDSKYKIMGGILISLIWILILFFMIKSII